jgi:hypothetical protein
MSRVPQARGSQIWTFLHLGTLRISRVELTGFWFPATPSYQALLLFRASAHSSTDRQEIGTSR